MAVFNFLIMSRALLIASLLQVSIADVVAPLSVTILDTHVTNCDIPISITVPANSTGLDIVYDTSKSIGTTPDVLAWSDSTSSTETICTVCTTFKWTGGLYGLIMSIDYDYYHRLDSGMLEQVASIITTNNGTSEEYFDFAYIYGSEETAITSLVHSTQANNSEALLLDFTKPSESVCVQTAFRMYNRVGVAGASGEISKKSVFTQTVNFLWQTAKPASS